MAPQDAQSLGPASLLSELWSFATMAMLAAGRGIGRNKLRSALTMLGIFIGVAALIAMLAVGEGARAALKAQLESLGTNLLVVLPGTFRSNGVRSGLGSASTLRVSDGAAILEEDSAVAAISYVNRQSAQTVNGNQNWSTTVQGVTPSYLAIRDWPVVQGRALDDQDESEGRTVCLIGQTVLENLFGDFQGAQHRLGQDGARSGDADAAEGPPDPARPARRLRGSRPDGDRGGGRGEQPRDGLLLAAIASISLLVGGIGIMNILLVSVRERTREIGVRMAIGARRVHVLLQFLVEAALLSLMGGSAGAGIGIVASKVISLVAWWPTLLHPAVIAAAFLFSAAIGVFFGWYPARQASLLNPIDALRYE